jgi:hypothetical protein
MLVRAAATAVHIGQPHRHQGNPPDKASKGETYSSLHFLADVLVKPVMLAANL